MLRVSGHGLHGFAFTLPPLFMLPDGSPPPNIFKCQKELKGLYKWSAKTLTILSRMTQRGIKKRKRGLFLVKGRERELGGRYPLAGLCPAFMCFKKKKKKTKRRRQKRRRTNLSIQTEEWCWISHLTLPSLI